MNKETEEAIAQLKSVGLSYVEETQEALEQRIQRHRAIRALRSRIDLLCELQQDKELQAVLSIPMHVNVGALIDAYSAQLDALVNAT